jgi:hypothetical protein
MLVPESVTGMMSIIAKDVYKFVTIAQLNVEGWPSI